MANLESLIQQMPMHNDSSVLHDDQAPISNDDDDDSHPGLQRLLERIRARYKLASSSLGMPRYTQLPFTEAPESAPSGPESNGPAESAKPHYSRVGGQLVDVTQLKY